MEFNYVIKEHFDKLCESVLEEGRILLQYQGPIGEQKVINLSNELEAQLIEQSVPKPVVRKLVFTAVEALQNVRRHGVADDDQMLGAFVVYQVGSDYKSAAFNLVDNDDVPTVQSSVDQINSMTKEELKKHYREVLENGELSKKGGAGLGLITLGLKSNGEVESNFYKVNNDVSMIKMIYTIEHAPKLK